MKMTMEVREFMRPATVRVAEPTGDGGATIRAVRCLVHASAHLDGSFLAEFEDGRTEKVACERVTFLDSGELFGEYGWGEGE